MHGHGIFPLLRRCVFVNHNLNDCLVRPVVDTNFILYETSSIKSASISTIETYHRGISDRLITRQKDAKTMMDETVEPMDVDTSFATDDSATQPSRDDKNEIANNQALVAESRYENRGGTFTTGIDIFSKEEQAKMEERAKRFGLQDKLNISQMEKDNDLYSSMGVADESENSKNIRLNALHMRGTKDMSTKDVFKYFEDYGPTSIEWINDVSCNVVWVDNLSAARALLKLSKKIVGLGEKVAADKHLKSEASSFDDENKLANDDCIIEVVGDDGSTGGGSDNKIDDVNAISLANIDCPLPPGLWRKGVDYPKSKVILLRFATRADKKHPNAEKMSDYYKKHGNPNFGGVKGLLTESRKRQYKQVRQPKKRTDNGFSDDEADKKPSKNPWGTLSETWGQNDSVEDTFLRAELTTEQKSSVKERLGFKSQARETLVVSAVPVGRDEESNSESNSDSSDEEWCKRTKVPRMRMHADDEEEKMLKKRIKQRTQEMHASMQSKTNDLRSRLRNPKGNPVYRDAIQVVVTNTSDRYRLTRPRSLTPEEEDDQVVERVQEVEVEAEEELEEGEWIEASEQIEEPFEEKDVEEEENEEDEEESEESDVSEKEVQGPKGSVIKVVPRVKPRVASTVWARLNNTKSDTKSEDRSSTKGDLRGTLKGDLRSRLGYQKRGRSPLRIEVKNDKYAEESSGSE